MASLIEEVSITDFKKLKATQIKELKSCEIYADGEYLGTFVNANTDYIRAQTEYKAQLSNTIGGKTLEEILEDSNVSVPA